MEAGGEGDALVDRRNETVREGGSMVKKSCEAHSNGSEQGGGSMQDVGGKRMIHKTVDNDGARNRLGITNS